MFFSGGLIPTYLVMSKLGFIDSMWVVIIPFCITAYNLIIAKTFFSNTIPGSLQEAAIIDGCNDWNLFIKVIVPLSKPIIAVIALYVAVGRWNGYFAPMIYIRTEAKQVLQVFLRDILILNQYLESMDDAAFNDQQMVADMIKYGIIIVSTIPMIIFYPFIQRYFVKGIMIGSIKG
jgi:putative aldouronate transport system permease protein